MVLGAVQLPEPSRMKLFLAGSLPVMMVVPALVADFHEPKTAVGEMAEPPHCQSWHRVGFGSPGWQMTVGSAVMSVRKSDGNNGRPEGSVAVRSQAELAARHLN